MSELSIIDKNIIALIATTLIEIIDEDESSESDSDIENWRELSVRCRVPRVKCKNYVENIVSSYSDMDFKMHFRMTRTTFKFLLELLTPHLKKHSDRFGRHPISPEKQLLQSIWMMATPNSYRCVSDRFGIGRATAWRSVRKVVSALYFHLHTFIKWPSAEEAKATWTFIKNKYGFPKVIGAIDGTHIQIIAPKNNAECYVNRKGYHSIQLQVICDSNLKFLHCYAGQVGSIHDMRVFRLSCFQNMCTEDNFPENSHLLGDAAYGIQKYIMVPFRDNGHLTESEIKYNKIHSSARMIVERSLGLLKGRFRSILDNFPMTRTDFIPKYIVACCILHNICLLHDDIIDIPIIINETQFVANSDVINVQCREEGIQKRNLIAHSLMNPQLFSE